MCLSVYMRTCVCVCACVCARACGMHVCESVLRLGVRKCLRACYVYLFVYVLGHVCVRAHPTCTKIDTFIFTAISNHVIEFKDSKGYSFCKKKFLIDNVKLYPRSDGRLLCSERRG